MSRNLVGATSIYLAANIANAAIPFMLLPVLTRVLSPEEYGKVVNFFVLISICSAFSTLGLHGAVAARWFDRACFHFASYLSTAFVVVGVMTIGVSGAVAPLVAVCFPSLQLSAGEASLAGIVSGAAGLAQIRLVLWQSQGQVLTAAGMQITMTVFNLALSLLGVLVLDMGAQGRIGAAAVAAIVAAVVAVWVSVARGDANVRPASTHVASIFRFGVPLIPHMLAGTLLSQSDRLIVGAVLGPSAVGAYGAVAQIGFAFILVSDAFGKAYYPWMCSRLAGESGRNADLVGVSYWSLPIFLSCALLCGFAITIAAPLLLGNAYQDSVHLVWWFLCGGAFSATYMTVAGFFFYSGRTEWLSAATLTSSAATIALGLLLVREFGVTGAAISYAGGQFILLLLAFVFAIRLYKLPWRNPHMRLKEILK